MDTVILIVIIVAVPAGVFFLVVAMLLGYRSFAISRYKAPALPIHIVYPKAKPVVVINAAVDDDMSVGGRRRKRKRKKVHMVIRHKKNAPNADASEDDVENQQHLANEKPEKETEDKEDKEDDVGPQQLKKRRKSIIDIINEESAKLHREQSQPPKQESTPPVSPNSQKRLGSFIASSRQMSRLSSFMRRSFMADLDDEDDTPQSSAGLPALHPDITVVPLSLEGRLFRDIERHDNNNKSVDTESFPSEVVNTTKTPGATIEERKRARRNSTRMRRESLKALMNAAANASEGEVVDPAVEEGVVSILDMQRMQEGRRKSLLEKRKKLRVENKRKAMEQGKPTPISPQGAAAAARVTIYPLTVSLSYR